MPWHAGHPRFAAAIGMAAFKLAALLLAIAVVSVTQSRDAPGDEHVAYEPGGTEDRFSERAGEDLRIVGYELLGFASAEPVEPAAPTPLGGAPAGYRLAAGDRLSVTVMDDPIRTLEAEVDRAGRLIVPGLPPIAVSGATLDEAASQLARLAAERMPGTSIDLVLIEAREIDVLVVGSVRRPGRVRLPAFATVLDAILAARGVRPGGSLRAIQHIASDGTGTPIDLFDLLQSGAASADATVHAGDRIIVPPIGPAVAVAGAVARPGIYELAPDEAGIEVESAIALAGGLVDGAPLRLAVLTTKEGRDQVIPIGQDGVLTAGNILLAGLVDGGSSAIMLEGHVVSPGPRSLADVPTLAALLSGDGAPRSDAYRPFAILSRLDPSAGGRRLEAFDLDDPEALAKIALEPGDRVGVLGPHDLDFLTSDLVLTTLTRTAAAGGCPAVENLARSLSGRLATESRIAPDVARLLTGAPRPCTSLFLAEPDWLAFSVARSALVAGDADRPGLYPIAGPTAVGRSGAASGEHPILRPGEIAILSRPAVELYGHARLPGRRTLDTAATLATLIATDGGAREDLYPLLGVLLRRDGPARLSAPEGFAPRDVIDSNDDIALGAGDAVYLMSVDDALALASRQETGRIRDWPPEVRRFVAERVVTLTGAVRRPGAYPILDAETLSGLFAAAGGLGDDADLLAIELVGTRLGQPYRQLIALDRTPAATVALVPGDAVNVPSRAGSTGAGSVLLAGEFARPGQYALRLGDRLSDLIARGGGFTGEAYPPGLVLARPALAAREREGNLAEAAALEAQLEAEIRSENPPPASLVGQARDAARRLAELQTFGRITVAISADGSIRPDADPYLEPGDSVTVPRRPAWVSVVGEVQAPGRFAHRPGGSVDAYIDLAGGTTAKADRGRIILIGPDGEAAPRSSGFLGGFLTSAPAPGSVVLVPAEVEGPDALDLVDKVTRVIGQIAITAASIAILAP